MVRIFGLNVDPGQTRKKIVSLDNAAFWNRPVELSVEYS